VRERLVAVALRLAREGLPIPPKPAPTLASALAIERNEKWMERRYLAMPDARQSEPELRKSA
jgi:hypothetical protein